MNYESMLDTFGDTQRQQPIDVSDSLVASELASTILGDHSHKMPWVLNATTSSGLPTVLPTIIRRSTGDVDFFFVMNRVADEIVVSLTVFGSSYSRISNVLTGEPIPFGELGQHAQSTHGRSSLETNMVIHIPARTMLWLSANRVV